jgi:predicted NBD/HSP70 family sugar kinase
MDDGGYRPGVAHALAVDVGGTKLAAAVVDDGGAVLRSARAATPRTGSAADVFDALLGVVDRVRAGDEVVCGVGCGGPMAPGGEEVSPLNIAAWRGFPLRSALAERLALDTFVDNDAKAPHGGWPHSWPWWCPPVWAAGSCSTGGCSTAPPATPATSAT